MKHGSKLDQVGKSFDLRVGHRVFDEREKMDWLNPIAMSTLKRAVEKHAETVVLNGLEFSITYGIIFKMRATGEDRECVMLKRTGIQPSAPFGYIAMKTIMGFEFES
jgi:hypothetical protein